MKKYLAELVGTFILVLFGCGTAVIAGDKVGILGIAFAFGLALIGAAYGIGPISGCHINPAVSLGVWVAGRMTVKEMIGYWVGQFVGAILAAWVLLVIAVGAAGYSIAVNGLGQDGWGPGYQGEYNIESAMVFEFVATLIFVVVILGSTQKSAPAGFAGLAIGITLVAIHIFGIHITGVSVNPARSLGPALLAGGQALPRYGCSWSFPAWAALWRACCSAPSCWRRNRYTDGKRIGERLDAAAPRSDCRRLNERGAAPDRSGRAPVRVETRQTVAFKAQAHIIRGPVSFFVAQDGTQAAQRFRRRAVSQMLGSASSAPRQKVFSHPVMPPRQAAWAGGREDMRATGSRAAQAAGVSLRGGIVVAAIARAAWP